MGFNIEIILSNRIYKKYINKNLMSTYLMSYLARKFVFLKVEIAK